MQELTTLKQQHANGVAQVDASAVAGANEKVAALEITIARLEHKCLQVVAERQMALDAATVPRYNLKYNQPTLVPNCSLKVECACITK